MDDVTGQYSPADVEAAIKTHGDDTDICLGNTIDSESESVVESQRTESQAVESARKPL